MQADRTIRLVLDPDSRGRLAEILGAIPRPPTIPPGDWSGIITARTAALTEAHIAALRTATPEVSGLLDLWLKT